MNTLFELKELDHEFYKEKLENFLPDNIIDIHTHVWREELLAGEKGENDRTVNWPSMVASENSIEDLLETYKLMFPGKKVVPLIFATLPVQDEFDALNAYVNESAEKYHVPSLIYSDPQWTADIFEKKIIAGNFLGAKSYLTQAPSYLPTAEIRIYDYFPHHQLEIMNKHGWIVMLHIPRNQRLKDPVNLAQMIEIEKKYPNIQLIIAHVGRAYCNEDVGSAFEMLSKTEKMAFDFSANCNLWVLEQLIQTVGPKRILFGSDMPILRMRTKRITENGKYINLVPKDAYGDVSSDSHMREVEGQEAETLTFFMYEEIDAFRQAAENIGLSTQDIEDIFYNNAAKILGNVNFSL